MSNIPLMVNAFDPSRQSGISATMAALLARRARVLGPSYKLFYEQPVHFVRGEGVRLYDEDGTAYLDVYNNVPSVGHCTRVSWKRNRARVRPSTPILAICMTSS